MTKTYKWLHGQKVKKVTLGKTCILLNPRFDKCLTTCGEFHQKQQTCVSSLPSHLLCICPPVSLYYKQMSSIFADFSLFFIETKSFSKSKTIWKKSLSSITTCNIVIYFLLQKMFLSSSCFLLQLLLNSRLFPGSKIN